MCTLHYCSIAGTHTYQCSSSERARYRIAKHGYGLIPPVGKFS